MTPGSLQPRSTELFIGVLKTGHGCRRRGSCSDPDAKRSGRRSRAAEFAAASRTALPRVYALLAGRRRLPVFCELAPAVRRDPGREQLRERRGRSRRTRPNPAEAPSRWPGLGIEVRAWDITRLPAPEIMAWCRTSAWTTSFWTSPATPGYVPESRRILAARVESRGWRPPGSHRRESSPLHPQGGPARAALTRHSDRASARHGQVLRRQLARRRPSPPDRHAARELPPGQRTRTPYSRSSKLGQVRRPGPPPPVSPPSRMRRTSSRDFASILFSALRTARSAAPACPPDRRSRFGLKLLAVIGAQAVMVSARRA